MRKLALSSLAFALGIFICHYVFDVAAVLKWIPLILTLSIGACFVLHGKVRIGLILFSIFFSLGVVRYDFHSDRYLGLEKNITESKYLITAHVVEYPNVYEDYTKVTVQLKTDLLPKVKTVLYDYDGCIENPDEMKPGQILRTSVRFTSAAVVSGEESDSYISDGVYLRGYFIDNVKCTDTKFGTVLYFPLHLAHEIKNRVEQYLPKEEAVFMNALLTGDKTGLYEMPEIYNSISRAGLAHIVAVSGMHVSFVIGLAITLLGNHRGWKFSIIMVFLFAIMTGLSPSVLRAAFMQVLFLLAPVLKRESDGLTSVGFALLILLLYNPFAIASISLQLSFASILGIILITPKMIVWFQERMFTVGTYGKQLYMFVVSSVSTSIGATIFTIPLSVYYFGGISVLAPITNLLVLWIVPCCFVLGFVLCSASLVSATLATFVASTLTIIVEFIYRVADIIAGLQGGYVYLPTEIMKIWIICVGALVVLTYFLNNIRFFNPIIVLSIATISLYVLSFGVKQYYNNGTTIAAIDVGQGQCIAILNDETTIMVDCGGASSSGEETVKWLGSHGRTTVDTLILTHFDTDHVNGVTDLITQIPVKEVMYCTMNLTEYEAELLNDVLHYTDMYQVDTTIVNRSRSAQIGNVDMYLYVPSNVGDNNGIMLLAEINGYDLVITGDANMKAEKEFIRAVSLSDGDCIVVGHHGSKYSTSEELLDRFTPEIAFISCGYNKYGHPTQEVLDRLNHRNVVIYRTDTLGSVEVRAS